VPELAELREKSPFQMPWIEKREGVILSTVDVESPQTLT
jgi:hypothetical protein